MNRLLGAFRSSVRLVWEADRRSMIVTTTSQVVVAVAGLASLLGLRQLIAELDQETGDPEVVLPLVVLIGCSAATSLFGIVIREMRLVANEAVERITTIRVLEGASRASYGDFEDPIFHDLLQRASQRAGVRAWAAVWASIGIVTGVLSAAAIAIALVLIAPVVFAVAVVAALPGFVIARRNSKLLYDFSYRYTSEDRRRQALERVLRERRFAAEVRSLGAEAEVRERIAALFADRFERIRAVGNRRLRSSGIAALVSSVLAGVALIVLVSRVTSGALSLADGLVALVALQQVASRARSIAAALSDLDEAGLYLADHDAFLEASLEKQASTGTSRPVADISIQDVAFTYPGAAQPAIHDVHLEIGSGEVVALVGENGSGKSTLAKVVSGLYQPDIGQIVWGGDVAGEADRLASTRCVFQDFARFPLSLRDNVLLGNPEGGLAEAIDSAGLISVVDGLDDGVETMLAREFDAGVDLSGGQWQRVAIARALSKHSSLVVLDEPAAALDARQEHDLVQRLRTACAGRTVLFISHRFSTVRSADRIIVLRSGEIVESGSHDALMDAAGLYAELFTLQAENYT